MLLPRCPCTESVCVCVCACVCVCVCVSLRSTGLYLCMYKCMHAKEETKIEEECVCVREREREKERPRERETGERERVRDFELTGAALAPLAATPANADCVHHPHTRSLVGRLRQRYGARAHTHKLTMNQHACTSQINYLLK